MKFCRPTNTRDIDETFGIGPANFMILLSVSMTYRRFSAICGRRNLEMRGRINGESSEDEPRTARDWRDLVALRRRSTFGDDDDLINWSAKGGARKLRLVSFPRY